MADIALITEATYPHAQGGVSVWCDQTIRGLAEHRFTIVALCGNKAAPLVWELPPNVASVSPIGLWDVERVPRASRAQSTMFKSAFETFLAAVFEDASTGVFIDSLHELFDLAQAGVLNTGLNSPSSIDLMLEHLDASPQRFAETDRPVHSVGDALSTIVFLEHFLRPLTAPAPRADLCHSVSNGLGVLVALAARWTYDTPFLLTEHGLYLRERYLEYGAAKMSPAAREFFSKFMGQLVRAGYVLADVISPASEYNRTWQIATGAPASKMRLIYNGVDPDEFPEPPPEPEVPTLVWLGRIDPLKDVETLIEAFGIVHEQRPEARLRLYGGVPKGNEAYAAKCRELVTSLNLDGPVTFEGRVDVVLSAYTSGHLVMNTSISEGFPYAVLEAMASGRCVVATDVGGVVEAIGDSGVLVPPRDPALLAAASLALLDDDERRQRLGAEGRDRIRTEFTVDQSNDAYRALYAELLTAVAPMPSATELEISEDDFTPVAVVARAS